MRIKNKEIRQRRHRKEQKIKEAARVVRAQYGEKKSTAPAQKKVATAAKKTSTAAKPTDSKPRTPPRPKKADGS